MSSSYCVSSGYMVSCGTQCNKYAGKLTGAKAAPVGLWKHGEESVMTSMSAIEWSIQTYKGKQYAKPSVTSIVRMCRHMQCVEAPRRAPLRLER